MINLLKDWEGEIEVNTKHYDNMSVALSDLTSETLSDDFMIKLLHKKQNDSYRAKEHY